MNRKGSLTIVSTRQQHPLNGGGSLTVKCDCGNTFECYRSRWNNYSGKGCGSCIWSKSFSGSNNPKYNHGMSASHQHEYRIYYAMKARCYYSKYRKYERYGGRGIKVCNRWLGKDGFKNFIADMGKRPSSKHSIDRIDNDGNYTPDNCRWATQRTQIKNSTTSVFVTAFGETKNLTDWHEDSRCVSRTTYYRRLSKGKKPSEAIVK